MTTKRKIIQIAASQGHILALCDDGTVWRMTASGSGGAWDWEQMPDVPAPEGLPEIPQSQ